MQRLRALHKSFCAFLVMFFGIFLSSLSVANAAVILQYHHVSSETPKITSIEPEQFSKHLALLKEKQYQVVSLPALMDKVASGQNVVNHVAITFDDGYKNLLEHAIPELERYGFAYTIFVNPQTIDEKNASSLTWAQLKALTKKGATIANHGMTHDSLARIPTGISLNEWIESKGAAILAAQARIVAETGQDYRLYAYPYGEYTPQWQKWMRDNGFVAFSQQSGAVGNFTDLSIVPRFPVSQPYDKISSLSDKLNTLAFDLTPVEQSGTTVVNYGSAKELVMKVNNLDFHPKLLACYVSGLGKQEVTWLDESTFKVTLSNDLNPGRQRCNCTAPSISMPSRYYWYSKPWFVMKKDGQWFPL